MGTRGLIAVKVDGEFKVAQYCQFDAYPEGQGVGVLGFLLHHRHIPDLRYIFSNVKYISDNELNVIQASIDSDKITNWKNIWPELSSSTGSDVLWDIASRAGDIELKDELEFVTNRNLCEYAYVIDYDDDLLSVYSSTTFDENIHSSLESHFKDVVCSTDSACVSALTRVIDFNLDKLPTLEDFVLKSLSVIAKIRTSSKIREADTDVDEDDIKLVNRKIFSNTIINLITPMESRDIETITINGVEYYDFSASCREDYDSNVIKEFKNGS